MRSFVSWAWTPAYLQRQEQQERAKQDLLILPDAAFNPQNDAAFAHFSGLKDGVQYSWLWVFPDDLPGKTEAVSLRTVTRFLPDGDIIGSLVEATLPRAPKDQPAWCYLQKLPIEWVNDGIIDLSAVDEVWLGFDWRSYGLDHHDVDRAARRYSTEEFRELCRRTTR